MVASGSIHSPARLILLTIMVMNLLTDIQYMSLSGVVFALEESDETAYLHYMMRIGVST
jgi:hypothetical protein